MDKMDIGKLIRQQRIKLNNMTQKELAEKCYTTESTVSKWESNKIIPNIETLKIIANILNVSPTIFLSETTSQQKVEEEIFFEIKASCLKWSDFSSKYNVWKKVAIIVTPALITVIGLFLALVVPFILDIGSGIGEESIKYLIPGVILIIVGIVLGIIFGRILIHKTNKVTINNRQNSIVAFKVTHIKISNILNELDYFEVPYSKVAVSGSQVFIAGDKNPITLFPNNENTLSLVWDLVRSKNAK